MGRSAAKYSRIGYRVCVAAGALTILVAANVPTRCHAISADGEVVHTLDGARERHEVPGRNGAVYRVELHPGQSFVG